MKYQVKLNDYSLQVFTAQNEEELVKLIFNYYAGHSKVIEDALSRCDNLEESVELYNEIMLHRDSDNIITEIHELRDPIYVKTK